MARLDDALRSLVGDKTAKVLADGLDLHTVRDLMTHYPRRWVQRGELTDLRDLRAGEHVTVFAEVLSVTGRKIRDKLHKTDVVVSDGTRSLTLTFFNQHWRKEALPVGRRAFFAGKVEEFNRKRQLTNPECQLVDDDSGEMAAEFAGAIIPIYPASAKASTFVVQRCVRLALDSLDVPDDPLPHALRERHHLVGYLEALRSIHTPKSMAEVAQAKQRLKWDEALVLQVALAGRRRTAGAQPATPRAAVPGGLVELFDAQLPFTLTAGQREVASTLTDELARTHPMHRLLQGEVGSGKTVVALRAMLAVVDAGGQAALLAPTEVLAAQHHHSITALLGPLALAGQLGGAERSTRVVLLTGSMGAQARRATLLDAASGAAGIVIGTHALLAERVQFADLGLVVIDEQHRFGVEQRDVLREKATGDQRPHVLVMTATPIPRTIAMTVYGDLDVSTLTELPAGRSPISTSVVPSADRPAWLERAWERVREDVAAGRQAYVVCPRIGEVGAGAGGGAGTGAGDDDGAGGAGDLGEDGAPGGLRPARAVLDVMPMLAAGPLAGLRVGMLHGRMSTEDKDAAMRAFVAGTIDVLVATTVVEVGVDVPNAATMVVMDADRFGVSQLHQLRGRVGRGSAPGLCLLVTEAEEGSPARQRLDAVAATLDGFALSELDLEQRREGTILGGRQHGRTDLKLLSLLRDVDLIAAAREEATALVEADPDLGANPGLAAAVADLLADERADFLEKA